MDFKKKFKNLLQKEGFQKVQKALSPNSRHSSLEGDNSLVLPSVLQFYAIKRDPEAELRSHPTDPEVDEGVLKTIDASLFTSDIDPSLYELERLPDPIDREYIQNARHRVLKELTVVSKKVFQLILEKQSCYTGEIQRVREIEDELEGAIFVCQESRKDLSVAKQQFTTKSLGILANYRKRQAAVKLLTSLRTIDTLQRTVLRLKEMLSEEDYPGAIQLLLECQQAAQTYSHFNCISELSKRLKETLENAEEQLDGALFKVCLFFDNRNYAKLQKAYQLLGKTQTCMDQLLMHYTSAVHNTAFSVVYGFAELCKTEESSSNLQKKQYQDLCSCISTDIFIPCLVELCRALWKIVLSYHKVIQWHRLDFESCPPDINKEYIDQKLCTGSIRIWQDIQTKVKTFLLAVDFTGFKIDEFMQILSVIFNLEEVGFHFCESHSETLNDCVRQASLRYFHKYHETKLDEIRIFLESEGWKICPVRSDFDLIQLVEFKFLKNRVASATNSESHVNHQKEAIFEKYSEAGSPFEAKKEESEEDIYALTATKKASEDENGKVLYHDHSATNNEEESQPMVTNTSLSILRLFGRYLHMMHLLKAIAYDVAIAISQLFEYYLYSVFLVFAAQHGEITIDSLSNVQLRAALGRIRDNLIRHEDGSGKVQSPVPSMTIDLRDENNLYGLAERAVASESCVFLSVQLDRLKSYMELDISESNWDSIAQLVDQAVIVSVELRKPVLAGVSCRALDYQSIVNQMEKVNWEVKELVSQHSNYVDVMLRGLQVFAMRIAAVGEVVSIPEPVQGVLWEQIFRFCCRVFVDGFCSAKKCSNGGRGLMQLDFTQFMTKLGKMIPVAIKNSPDREYAESYIKAYYMPDTIMEEWIQAHTEYTTKQLTALVNCALQGNKKSRQRLLALIEEMDKVRR